MYLQASASLGQIGVPVDPVHAVHVHSKPAHQLAVDPEQEGRQALEIPEAAHVVSTLSVKL